MRQRTADGSGGGIGERKLALTIALIRFRAWFALTSTVVVTLSTSQDATAAVTMLKTANPPIVSAVADQRPRVVTG